MSNRLEVLSATTRAKNLIYLNSRIALCLLGSLSFIPRLGLAQSGERGQEFGL